MSSEIRQALSNAILSLLRPLIRVLLRNGMAYGTFAELAKKVYVDVAFDDFTTAGRKQTVSKVSVLTGLTRKEVKRLNELEPGDDLGAEQRYNRAIRVISGWLNDQRFADASGEPATLPIEAGEQSFAALVKEYSGDIPTQAMLSALEAAGSVERDGDRVRLVQHAYVPSDDPIEKLHILGTDTRELISTIDHNITQAVDRSRLQLKVSNDNLRTDQVLEFHRVAAEKSRALLEELDAWLSAREADKDEEGRYVSLGVYFYEDPSSQEQKK